MLPSTDDIKMHQAIWNKKSDYAVLARTGFAQKPGKRGSVICRIQYDQGEKFSISYLYKVHLSVLLQNNTMYLSSAVPIRLLPEFLFILRNGSALYYSIVQSDVSYCSENIVIA